MRPEQRGFTDAEVEQIVAEALAALAEATYRWRYRPIDNADEAPEAPPEETP